MGFFVPTERQCEYCPRKEWKNTAARRSPQSGGDLLPLLRNLREPVPVARYIPSGMLLAANPIVYFVQFPSVKNGVDAGAVCRNHADLDLILMDIKMPGMNGYE